MMERYRGVTMNWKLLAVMGALLGAAPAAAQAKIEIYGGANYWMAREAALFDVGVKVGAELADNLSLGFRGGVYVVLDSNRLGIPLDVFLNYQVHRTPLYFEAMVGPWLSLSGGDFLRTHGGGGFGLQFGAVKLGVEAAYLAPGGMLGARLGIEL